MYIYIYIICIYIYIYIRSLFLGYVKECPKNIWPYVVLIEGSLEVKLPTIWTD